MALAEMCMQILHATTNREHAMNKFKYLGLLGLAAASLFAGQAYATTCNVNSITGTPTMGSPVCINTSSQDGASKSLQNEINGITTGVTQINVYNGQYSGATSYWSMGASGGGMNTIMLEIAGNANTNTFGIFDPTNTGNYLQLFDGAASQGARTTLTVTFVTTGPHTGMYAYTANYLNSIGAATGSSTIYMSGDLFGYYLGAASNTPTFFSDSSMNPAGGNVYPNGMPHMATYQGTGATSLNHASFSAGEWLLAWDDSAWGRSDQDYNDFVVMVESVHPVPEPAELGMFGLGLLLIGGFVAIRRRRQYTA